MEKRINKFIETYIVEFKDNIRKKMTELDFDEKTKEIFSEYELTLI